MMWELILGGVIGSVPALAGLWSLDLWRAGKRNRGGACANCGTAWTESPSGERFLIHGRLVCSPCAERTKSRLPWYFGVIGAATIIATTGIGISKGLTAGILFPLASVTVLAVTAVKVMQLANRRAEKRIAAGEFPELLSDASDAEALPGT